MVYPVPGGFCLLHQFLPQIFLLKGFKHIEKLLVLEGQYSEYVMIIFHLNALTIHILLHLAVSLSLSPEPFES